MEVPKLKESLLEVDDRIATLTFMRHDVRNALTGTALMDDILHTVNWANIESGVSVLIITGDGSAFCSGGNIKEMHHKSGTFAGSVIEIQDNYRHGIQQVPLAMHKAEIPIIAAVNGPAIGAGFDLACMCDLRIASSKAVVGETFINLGITPGDGAIAGCRGGLSGVLSSWVASAGDDSQEAGSTSIIFFFSSSAVFFRSVCTESNISPSWERFSLTCSNVFFISINPLARERARPGSLSGPTTISATAKITIISGRPIPNMGKYQEEF